MNWYKESQYSIDTQKDFHRQMVQSYRRNMIEAHRQLLKYKKRDNQSLVEKYEKKLLKIQKRIDYHEKRILYYERRDEKEDRYMRIDEKRKRSR